MKKKRLRESQSSPETKPEQTSAHSDDTMWDYLCMLIIFVGGLMLYTYGIGSYALWDPWEPKYAQAVREMIERKDFITPYFDNDPRWTKPIFIYWITLIPISIFGNNEFTARFPSGIVAVLGLLVMFHMLNKLRNRRTAMIGACIMGTLPQFYFLARQIIPDIYLIVFMSSAMCFFALAKFGNDHKKLYFGLFYASVALGFLTKGPIAVLMPTGAIVIFWLINIDSLEVLDPKNLYASFLKMWTEYHVGLGIIIFILVSGPWYILIFIEHGDKFIDKFFGSQNLHRFTEPVTGHDGTIDFYLRTMFHGTFPWGSFLPMAMIFLFYKLDKRDEETRFRWFILSWFCMVFLLFTVAASKYQHYIAPIMGPLAVIIALFWEQYFSEKPPFWMKAAFLISMGIAYIVFTDFAFMERGHNQGARYAMYCFTVKRNIYNFSTLPFFKTVIAAFLCSMILAILVRNSRIVVALIIMTAYGYGFYFTHVIIPSQEPYKSLKNYVSIYQRTKKPGDKLILFAKRKFSVNYYTNNDFEYFSPKPEDVKEMIEYMQLHKRFYLITRDVIGNRKAEKYILPLIKQKTGYDLYYLAKNHPQFDLVTNIKLGIKAVEKPDTAEDEPD